MSAVNLLDDEPAEIVCCVGDSIDLQRILALPVRYPDRKVVVGPRSKAKPCDRPKCPITHLNEIQGRALTELRRAGGLFGAIGVGHGKTLISLLAHATVRASHTALLVPASIVPQTLLDADHFRQHFPAIPPVYQWSRGTVIKPGITIVTYTDLSTRWGGSILPKLHPELLVADEAHRLRHLTAVGTSRVDQFIKAERPICVMLSGTMASRSCTNFSHLMAYCLKAGSPLPLNYHVLQQWAGALDPLPRGGVKWKVGHLSRLMHRAKTDNPVAAVHWRMAHTPGVIFTTPTDAQPACSLRFGQPKMPAIPTALSNALNQANFQWLTPDGREMSDAIVLYGLLRHLSYGLYTIPDFGAAQPEAITAWKLAHNAWHGAVRNRLQLRIPEQDSPALCYAAAEKGIWSPPEFERWRAVRGLVSQTTKYQWITDVYVNWAADWPQALPDGAQGIIWSECPAWGKAVAYKAGIRYYGDGEDDAADLARLPLEPKESIVVSISHREGRNLQMFHHNLLMPLTDASAMQQLLGRTHRTGQQADVVYADLMLHTTHARECWNRSRHLASGLAELMNEPQRILYGNLAW